MRAAWDEECRKVNGERRRVSDAPAPAVELPDVVSLESCPACSGHHVQVSVLQTRGADEPMTEFYYCEDCRHRWKN